MRSGVVFRVDSLESMRRVYEHEGQPRRLHPYGSMGFNRATLCKVAWDNGTLFYSELAGGIVNATSAKSGQVVIGTVAAGRVTVHRDDEALVLQPGESMLFLPGDMVLQVLENPCLFTLRIPVSIETLFRLECKPARLRSAFPRQLPDAFSTDLVQLFKFISNEFDRLEGQDRTAQMDALGHAIIDRVERYIESVIEPSEAPSEGLLSICIHAAKYLERHAYKSTSTKDLAKASHCSVRTLHRAFEAIADTTPADYQTRARLNHGRALLFSTQAGDPSLADIAQATGFTSARSFIAAYTSEFGLAPKDEIARYTRKIQELSGLTK